MCADKTTTLGAAAADSALPVMYLDVDDTLVRWEGPEAGTAAPGAGAFLLWAVRHFEVRWLSYWSVDGVMSERRGFRLAQMLGVPAEAVFAIHGACFAEGLRGSKLDAIDWAEHEAGRAWVWVEDEYCIEGFGMDDELDERGCLPNWLRCNVSVEPQALGRVRKELERRFGCMGDCAGGTGTNTEVTVLSAGEIPDIGPELIEWARCACEETDTPFPTPEDVLRTLDDMCGGAPTTLEHGTMVWARTQITQRSILEACLGRTAAYRFGHLLGYGDLEDYDPSEATYADSEVRHGITCYVSAIIEDASGGGVWFLWDGFGPCSNTAGVGYLTLPDGRTYLTTSNDWEDDTVPEWQVVGRIESQDHECMLRECLMNVIASGGEWCDVPVLGGLPSETHNGASGILTREHIEKCYWEFVNGGHSSDTWEGLRSDLSDMLAGKTSLDVALEFFEKAGEPAQAVLQRIAERKAASNAMSEDERRAVLKAFLDLTYRQ